MDILYLLIPLSAVLVLAIIGVFGWALYRGQFEDLEHEGERILDDEAPAAVDPAEAAYPPAARGVKAGRAPAVDVDQARAPSAVEESPPRYPPDSKP